MKGSILAIICLSILSSVALAGDVNVKVSAVANSCGEAGVEAYKACISKSREDVYRTMDLNTEFSKEVNLEDGTCKVIADCTYYEIID